jgi:predicted small metal-binding protein
MTKLLSCREIGCDCDYIVTGETEEEVMRNAAEHDIKEHSRTKTDMVGMREKLRGFIYTIYK